MFIAQLVAIIIGTVVSIPIVLWWFYTYGVNRVFFTSLPFIEASGQKWAQSYRTITADAITPHAPNTTFTLPMFIIGIILAVVLYMLRARFPWFMLTPIGLVMALTWNCGDMWVPFLVALIAKWLTFRIGGATLYEKKGLPIAVGLITGIGFTWALAALLYAMRSMGIPLIP